jgi:hypothetical protein
MPRCFGHFRVSKVVNSVASQLILPEYMGGIHSVFHVSLLQNFNADGEYKRQPPPLRAAGIGFEEEWLVGAVRDHRQVDVRCTDTKGEKKMGIRVQATVVTHLKKLQYLCH